MATIAVVSSLCFVQFQFCSISKENEHICDRFLLLQTNLLIRIPSCLYIFTIFVCVYFRIWSGIVVIVNSFIRIEKTYAMWFRCFFFFFSFFLLCVQIAICIRQRGETTLGKRFYLYFILYILYKWVNIKFKMDWNFNDNRILEE